MGGYPWRAGIVDADGQLCGAGVLLTNRLVLTCAHVVAQPKTAEPQEKIGIEFVGLPGLPPGIATVLDGCWIPEQDDQRGDIALLRLATAIPGPMSAPLRNLSLRNRQVMAQGYPDGTRIGAEWAAATVIGPGGPNDEWVQLNPRSPVGPRIRYGFSGAGVVDERTGHVVGIVVAKARLHAEAAWMIPMDTIAPYLPEVQDLIAGDAAADEGFLDKARDPLIEVSDGGRREHETTRVVHATRVVTGWLRPSPQGIAGNIVGPPDAERSAAIATVVSLTDPVTRRQLPAKLVATVPPDMTLPTRSVDVAVQATGRTTAQIVRRIADRAGIDVNTPDLVAKVVQAAAGMSIVVDSADEADAPDDLLRTLLEPVAESAPNRGGRLVVGSRTELLPGSGMTVMHIDGSSDERLDRLDATIAEVDAAERLARQRYAEIAPRIADAPKPPGHAPQLHIAAFALRAAGVDDATLARTERAAVRGLQQAGNVVKQLDALRSRRDQLRGLLEAYKTRAVGPLAEDAELAGLYSTARDLLWHGPCDLDAAQTAVDGYLNAVRRRLGQEEA